MRGLLVVMLAAGCTGGFGPSTAATRPLLGNVSSSDADGWVWRPSGDQSGVPKGFQRVHLVHDDTVESLGAILQFLSLTSGVRKGSVTWAVDGEERGTGRQTIDMELSLLVHAPLPIGVALGPMIGWALEAQRDEPGDMRGVGFKASVAPIGQLSVDFTNVWGDGGRNTTLGGTVLLYGYGAGRFGVSVARTWTSIGDYTSKGYSYSLVTTIF